MSRLIIPLALALSLVPISTAEKDARADIPPPPTVDTKVLQSPDCPMPKLKRGVSARDHEIQNCLERGGGLGEGIFACTFDPTGKVALCSLEPPKKGRIPDYNKDALACVQKVLGKLRLDANSDAQKCVARIEIHWKVRSNSSRYHHYAPDDPLNPNPF